MATLDDLLSIPAAAGRKIVETGAIIACPLLGTDRFIEYCRKRDVSIDRERLVRFERLGLFAPIFRVRTPEETLRPFHIPLLRDNNWFRKGYAWDTTGTPTSYQVPNHKDRTQEGYYSIFQIDHLHLASQQMTLTVQLDAYCDLDKDRDIDWNGHGGKWMELANSVMSILRTHEYRRSVALLCQYISNRYHPQTKSDQRTIRVGGASYSDKWITVNARDWDWNKEVRAWNPQLAANLFDLTPEKLRHAYEGLAFEQAHCDPLEHWYQLTQFVSLTERERLKDSALRAETLRSGAHMLRLLYRDLYGEELSHPNEVTKTILIHVPELPIRQDVRRYLEFVANRFGLNPQPKLALILEGQSEGMAVPKILEGYFGVHPGIYGIEIIELGSVGTATGSKREDRFRAILRLIDYLHHHHTFTFILLDNENYARRLKQEARKAKSIHSKQRHITRSEYIHIWKQSFEFDNFSCSEIATAISDLAQGQASFTTAEVAACAKDPNPGSRLKALYEEKARYGLQKVKLNERLVDLMMSRDSRRRLENRPIIQILKRVTFRASKNLLPTMHDVWIKNQASKYFGKKWNPNARQLSKVVATIWSAEKDS